MQQEHRADTAQNGRPRLLAVLAHPDDETFGMGGTLALYGWYGAAVHLICTTSGEAGIIAPQFLERYGSEAATREAELHCAAEKLGLARVHLLRYRDSGMPGTPDNEHPQSLYSAPLEEVTLRIARLIRVLRPHVVITFDPIGGYRHPDHIITHRATVAAFGMAADPSVEIDGLATYQSQKLYYHVFPRMLLRLFVRSMPLFGKDPTRFGKNQDVDLTSFVNEEFPVHARIDFRMVEAQRRAAVACHASQNSNPTLTQSAIGALMRLMSGGECFMRAYPPPAPGLRERDLLAGVHID